MHAEVALEESLLAGSLHHTLSHATRNIHIFKSVHAQRPATHCTNLIQSIASVNTSASDNTTKMSGNDAVLNRVKNIKDVDSCRSTYDDWADTYNADLTSPEQDYVAPTLAAQAVLAANGNVNGTVFDAGCGTGLSGVALFQTGAKNIDGVDLSPGMLAVAEKTGVYQNLTTADLSKRIEKDDHTYDVVTCVGTLTDGHVGADPALKEFVRITKKGGVIVATVHADVWSTGGYKEEVDRLKEERKVDVISTESADYRKGAGVKAKMVVLRKK